MSRHAVTAMAISVGVCSLVFYPYVRNANLIKELIWYAALPLVFGLHLIAATPTEISESRRRLLLLISANRLLMLTLASWLILCFANATRSPDELGAAVALLRQAAHLATFICFAILLRRGPKQTFLWKTLLGASLACAVYVIAQSIGWDFIRWADPTGRPPGSFANPNFTANFLAAIVPMLLFVELFGAFERRMKKGEAPVAAQRVRLRLPILSLIVLAAILLTQSRAGLIAMVVGLSSAIFLARLSPRSAKDIEHHASAEGGKAARRFLSWRVLQPKFALRCLGLSGVLFLLATLIYTFMPERAMRFLDTATIQLRIMLWKGSIDLWLERPWLGWGLGSFAVVSQKIIYLLEPIAGNRRALHAHSWFFEYLVELGVFGTLTFLFIVAQILAVSLRLVTRSAPIRDRLFHAGIMSGMLALLSGTLVGVWLNWWGGGWLFWLLAGLVLAMSLDEKTTVSSGANRIRDYSRISPRSLLGIRAMGFGSLLLGVAAILLGSGIFRSEVLIAKASRLKIQDYDQTMEAIDLLDGALGSNRFATEASYQKALRLAHLQRWTEAGDTLDRGKTVQPESASIHLLRFRIALGLGDHSQAERHLIEAHELQPSGEIMRTLAEYYVSTRRIPYALELIEAQLMRASHLSLLHFYLDLKDELGQTGEAKTFVHRLRENPPFNLRLGARGRLARWEAELSSILEDWPGAIEAYLAALQIRPNDFELWNDYGLSCKKGGRLDDADEAFARSMKLQPDHFAPALNRLELALSRGNLHQSKELLARIERLEIPRDVRPRLDFIRRSILADGRSSVEGPDQIEQ